MVVAMDRRKNNGRIKGNHYKFRAIIVVLIVFLHFGQTKLLIIFALYDFDCQKRRSLYFSGKVMMMMIH